MKDDKLIMKNKNARQRMKKDKGKIRRRKN